MPSPAARIAFAYVPPAHAVEEFKVMTTVYDAQYGKTGGGVINVSILRRRSLTLKTCTPG